MKGDELVWQGNPSLKGMFLWHLRALGIALVVDLGLFVLQMAGVFSMAIWVLLALVSLVAVFGFGHLVRRTTIYRITRLRVSEKRGIINTTKEQAAVNKITNITVTRNLAERLLGIGRINIDTAADFQSQDILRWWGVEDPYKVESIIDGLRIDAEEAVDQARSSSEDPYDD